MFDKYNLSISKYTITRLFLMVLIVSFVVGGAAGGVLGFFTSNFFANYFGPWFGNNLAALRAKSGQATGALCGEEEALIVSAVQNTLPSVVSIVISKDVSKMYNATGPDVFGFNDEFFKQFGFPFEFNFGGSSQPSEPKNNKNQKPEMRIIGGGTGFIISSDGLIVTNRHVVSDAEAEYAVVLSNNKKYPAKVLATDAILDVALVKIDEKGLPVVKLGNSDILKLGQTVIAIGNSLSEYPNTVTRGVISGRNRRVVAGDGAESEVIEGAIQTDAAINAGNSGGPLLNLGGEVVGINTAVNQSGQSIGFAIPINSVKHIMDSVKLYGRIVRQWLGVRYILINDEIAKANNLSVSHGALIQRGQNKSDLAIIPGSPADKAGLLENDIILEVNGARVDESHSLATLVGKYAPGQIIKLKIFSKGKERMVEVKLEEYRNQ